MTYIVAHNGIYSHHAATGNVIWDATHTCPADKLTPDEAALFGVFQLVEVDPPPCGPDETAELEDPALVDGQWLQQWAVRAATQDHMIYGKRKNSPLTAAYFDRFSHALELESW